MYFETVSILEHVHKLNFARAVRHIHPTRRSQSTAASLCGSRPPTLPNQFLFEGNISNVSSGITPTRDLLYEMISALRSPSGPGRLWVISGEIANRQRPVAMFELIV